MNKYELNLRVAEKNCDQALQQLEFEKDINKDLRIKIGMLEDENSRLKRLLNVK